jgi:hypothetical protein
MKHHTPRFMSSFFSNQSKQITVDAIAVLTIASLEP